MTEGSGDTKIQLGCGTLIIIAIIVMVFSGGRGSSQVKSEVRQLQQQIDRLENKIDELSRKVDGLSSPKQGGRSSELTFR